jgi:acyl dehydratase
MGCPATDHSIDVAEGSPMGVNPDIAGRAYPPAPVYEVGREKIAEFAAAIGSDDPAHRDPEAARALGHRDVIAPPTFAIIVAQRAEASVVKDPEAGIDYSRVVHGEQRFTHYRPVVAGDRLVATPHVDGVREAGGHAMVTTRVEIVTEGGEPISTAVSVMVVRGGE